MLDQTAGAPVLCLITAFPFGHLIKDLALQGCKQASCQSVAEAKNLQRSYLGTNVQLFSFYYSFLTLFSYVMVQKYKWILQVLFLLLDSYFHLLLLFWSRYGKCLTTFLLCMSH